ncbi:MAG: alpha/beta hydrolase [Desulforhopalus sp.]
MITKPFEIPFGGHLLRGDTHSPTSNTLVLHGAGQSSRAGFSRLREALYQNGIPSVSFDFIGHGETGGQLIGSSLRERTNQAAAVIRENCSNPLTILGASMSGYTAIKLTELFPVDNLILLVPAVYSYRVYDTAFGDKFSEVIRSPRSWQDSDAFTILSEFKGNLVIIAAEYDDVIPAEIVQRIQASAKRAKKTSLYIVPGSNHRSLFPTRKEFFRGVDIILKTCLLVTSKS